jgi:hypothetical protein
VIACSIIASPIFSVTAAVEKRRNALSLWRWKPRPDTPGNLSFHGGTWIRLAGLGNSVKSPRNGGPQGETGGPNGLATPSCPLIGLPYKGVGR